MADGIRPAAKPDFDKFQNLVDKSEGWVRQYDKHGIVVHTKSEEGVAIKMVKIETHFDDISLDVLYDTLHDTEYRSVWDNMMLEEAGLCQIGHNSDVGYYAVRCPNPLRNRDFVLQRYWVKSNNDFMICNHSVQHKNAPIRREYIRAASIMSGCIGKTNGLSGCHFTYVSQMDPKGSIPKWMVNKVATRTAPKVISNIKAAATKYAEWKLKNNPNYKPWINTEQNILPIAKLEDFKSSPMLDTNLSQKLNSEAHALAAPHDESFD